MKRNSIAGRLYSYQKIRFPLIILALSLIPAILSTKAVIFADISIFQVAGVLLSSILYLLHIRILDEYRDFSHDNKHHSSRPLQTGLISWRELQLIDTCAIIIFLAIAISAGIYVFLFGVLMLTYSYLAGKEFFLGKKIRRHFFLYNAVNIIQMFLLQLFAYIFFAGAISFSVLIILHYIFTCIGTVVFEFVRKVKIPGKDGTGKDTYTWYLGFRNAIIIHIFLGFLISVFFYQIIILIGGQFFHWLFISVLLFCIMLLFSLQHLHKRTLLTEQLMQVSFIIIYVTFNLIIYFTKYQ